jgi:hypothetical protein
MTSISHVEHRNGTSVAQDSVLADEGGAFAFDIEVDVNKVDLETSGVQKGLTLRIVIVPRETNDRSYDWDNRRHNVSPGSTLDQTTGVAGVDDMMDFLLDSTCMGCESVQPVQSILKAPRSWILGEEEKVGKDYREERAVEFKTVVIREFGMTLGDHPNAISGPPVRIDWDEEKEERHLDFEEYEQSRQPRRSRKDLQLSLSDRHRILVKERGHSFDEIKGAWKEALEIRAQRKETLSQTPMQSKWEEVYESLCRKYSRLISCSILSCV